QKEIDELISKISRLQKDLPKDNNLDSDNDFVLSSLYIDDDDDKGRCVKTKSDISFGECVLQEAPYVSYCYLSLSGTYCSYCFKKTTAIIPCYYCAYAAYCSLECMKIAWKSYHWLECSSTNGPT
uniref:MYND-type domain-containing protein n=1 Tax=Amphimedon queenslandica TaxID=400682 RepID=A0A1X7UHC4_AMPQE